VRRGQSRFSRLTLFARNAALLLVLVATACVPPKPPPIALAPVTLTATRFSLLTGWDGNDAAPALGAFRRSCALIGRAPGDGALGGIGYGGTAADWRGPCDEAKTTRPEEARRFFESAFVPYRIGGPNAEGLFTGYYEPELQGSRIRHGPYQTPLYGVPSDLITADLGDFRESLKGQRIVGRLAGRRLLPYPSRAEIVRDGLMAAPVLFWVEDPIAAFFLQIQGSGRIVLDDGTVARAAFAAQNGHVYTAIGRVLVAEGAITPEQASLQTIRAWMKANPDRAMALMDHNASYVFFSEQPIGDPALGAAGSEGVALTPEASLAVDRSIHPMGVPIFLETTAPDPDPAKPERAFDHLLIAQDAGGAIAGPIRGDVYWGFGPDAEAIAGRMRSQGRLTVLLPKAVAARLGLAVVFPREMASR
jgi:peptidoglycan lytic transglycosylase A